VLSASALLGATSLAASLVMMRPIGRVTTLPLSETARAAIWPAHWKYGRWSGAIGPLVWIQGTIYYFVLPIWGGLPASGAFKALMNLAMPILQSDGALATLLTPAFVRQRRQRGGLSRIMALSSAGFALESLVYGLVLVVFGERLLDWIYGGAYRYDPMVLVLLALMPLVASQGSVLSSALRAREQPQALFWAAVASAVVVDTLGVAAAVTRGIEGALIGSLLGGVAQILVMLWVFRRPAPATHS
jgi:O-antigen/teichoic acid export membrane protein